MSKRAPLRMKQELRAHTNISNRSLLLGLRSNTLSYMKRVSKVLTVSLPPDSAADFEKIAKEEGRNKSELFREMLRIYRAYRETRSFEALQRYGASQARASGISTEKDVDRLVQEFRRDR